MSEDTEIMPIEDYLAKGGVLTSPANVPARYRGELLRLMAIFVDSGAPAPPASPIRSIRRRYYRPNCRLPHHIGEADHAERVLGLMGDFGADQGATPPTTLGGSLATRRRSRSRP